MHFPRFVLKGFIIGAALCFPSIALADKTDHVPSSKGKQSITTESNGQGHGLGYSQNRAIEHVKKAQEKGQQLTSQIQKTLPKKTKKAVKNLHAQAEKIIHTKDVKNGINNGLKKGHFKTGNITSVSKKPEQTEKKSTKVDVKTNTLPKMKPQPENQVSAIKKPVSVPSNNKKTLAKKSQSKRNGDSSKFVSKPKKDMPDPDKSLPQVIQIITTTTLGGNNSTGSSNDRYNTGTNTMSLAGWFEWENYKLPSFNRLFISRTYELCNQWTNAPPVQPPK
ncbi:MAG: hypothetical protein ACO1OT_08385 [Heyndrickxia sp.]